MWTLKKNKQGQESQGERVSDAILTCEDGNSNRVYSKRTEFTDFPLDEVTLWSEGGTLYLPSER